MENTNETQNVWYVLQTRYCKEMALKEYLHSKELNCFIPMRYVEDEKNKKKCVPAVHNFLFLEKTLEEEEMMGCIKDCPILFWIVRHQYSKKPYEISNKEMIDMRAVCDPDYTGTIYTDIKTAEARPGSKVRVVHGPFTGLVGKLTQYKKRYYVVITAAKLGVMLHIPKWYCEKINE